MCGSRKPSSAPQGTCAAGPRRSDMTETLARKATAGRVNRRQSLVGSMATGAGLRCGFSLLPTLIGGAGEALAAGNFSPTVWYTIDRGGIITVHITKSEMGQYVGTALAQAVAEALEADWKDIRIDYPDPAERWGLMVTGGSWSVNNNFDTLSRCGAAGRMALIEGGAKAMGVPEGECRAASSRVVHKSGKSISYADLVSSGKVDKTYSPDDLKKIQLKKAGDYKIVGKPVPALDIPAKTNGTARYGMDMFVPGMAYAKIARPSVRYGAKATNVDDSEAKNIPGYQQFVSVADPTGTATHYVMAIADSYPAAMAAANALKIEWDLGPNAGVSSDGILEHAKQLTADPAKGLSFWDIGDAGKALAGAATKLEAEYVTPLALHAPLEPMNCVAFDPYGTWHIYSASQFRTRPGPLAAPSGQFRSVAPAWTFWAVESFVDELAHKANKDPVAFRLAMLDATGRNAGTAPNSVGGAKRIAEVIKVAVDKSGYGKKQLPKGRAMGLAAVSSQERNTPTWTAGVAEGSVAKDGTVKLH